jgi:hypothetical protein
MTWIDALHPDDSDAEGSLEPISLPQTVAYARAVLGEAPTAWAVQRAKWICDEYEQASPREDGGAIGVNRPSCEAALLSVLVCIRTGQPRMEITGDGVEAIRNAVRRGARIEAMMRAIWFSHTTAQTALFEVLYRELPPDQLVGELRVVSDRMLTFMDELTRAAVRTYDQERASWEDRLAATRRRAIDHIIEHGTAPEGGEQLLGIRLAAYHLAAFVRLAADVPEAGGDGGVGRYAAAVAATIGAANTFVLGRSDGSTLIVWSMPAVPQNPVAAIRSRVSSPGRSVVVLGPVGPDVTGLQNSLLGARQAALVADQRDGPGTLAFDEVALQALLLADPGAAARFLRHVLQGLTGTDNKSAILRETLWAYLRHGRSRLAAAEELHVAPNTVAYRVHQAEERLETRFDGDATALVVALRLAGDFPALLG